MYLTAELLADDVAKRLDAATPTHSAGRGRDASKFAVVGAPAATAGDQQSPPADAEPTRREADGATEVSVAAPSPPSEGQAGAAAAVEGEEVEKVVVEEVEAEAAAAAAAAAAASTEDLWSNFGSQLTASFDSALRNVAEVGVRISGVTAATAAAVSAAAEEEQGKHADDADVDAVRAAQAQANAKAQAEAEAEAAFEQGLRSPDEDALFLDASDVMPPEMPTPRDPAVGPPPAVTVQAATVAVATAVGAVMVNKPSLELTVPTDCDESPTLLQAEWRDGELVLDTRPLLAAVRRRSSVEAEKRAEEEAAAAAAAAKEEEVEEEMEQVLLYRFTCPATHFHLPHFTLFLSALRMQELSLGGGGAAHITSLSKAQSSIPPLRKQCRRNYVAGQRHRSYPQHLESPRLPVGLLACTNATLVAWGPLGYAMDSLSPSLCPSVCLSTVVVHTRNPLPACEQRRAREATRAVGSW